MRVVRGRISRGGSRQEREWERDIIYFNYEQTLKIALDSLISIILYILYDEQCLF